MPRFEPLNGDVDTNVLIVGGGLAGILCAYMLHQAGVDYVLVEADRICHGVTRNTTAKITVQHGLIYDKLSRQFGVERARLYWQANREALETYRALCADMDCDFQEQDSYVYSLDRPEKLTRELAALKRIGCPSDIVRELPLPFATAGAVCIEKQAQFHPLKFAAHIAQGLNIFENTSVRAWEDATAQTKSGHIRARKVILATHFPQINIRGLYFLKLYQHRSYVLALENAPGIEGMYVDECETGLSFREYNGLLLLGGGSHRTGKKGGGWAELAAFARKYYPGSGEVCRWATQDCMTLDAVPYVGVHSAGKGNFYVATGFNKWGMTSAMMAATILCDLVQGKQNRYAQLFSPSRSMLRPQLAVNALESTVNLLTPTVPRCPHMGCALKWNRQERTWDCPCHGSRFTREGKLLDIPATKNLKQK